MRPKPISCIARTSIRSVGSKSRVDFLQMFESSSLEGSFKESFLRPSLAKIRGLPSARFKETRDSPVKCLE